MSAFSRAGFRSASLSVTPNHLVRDIIESLRGEARLQAFITAWR
jgi:hypothetical protein